MRTKSGWAKSGWMTAVAAVLAVGGVQASESTRHEAQSMEKAKISLTEAIRMAEKQANGQATSAEYENKNPSYYEVKVLRNDGQKLTKYEIDAATGKVREVSDESFEKMFTRLKPISIQNAPTSLTRAIATAETRAGGKAQEATVNRDGDQLQYDIKVVKDDGTTEKLKINGSDGKVASAK